MYSPLPVFDIERHLVGVNHPAYFIADIAANHDGDLERAKDLIYLAAESGADAAKFQHFTAQTIVSDVGFRALGQQASHQSGWKKSVFEVYSDASVKMDWTASLKEACSNAGIAFFTSPYSYELVDHIDPYVPAYKIGSGDITWDGIISYIAKKNKPYILATGASSLEEVKRAVEIGLSINPKLALLQCNTNYTGDLENFRFINLNVLKAYATMYPSLILGLSDHTPGHATVLGAIALGAKIIEKHFTDNVLRSGPDHAFSMDPKSWREMVNRARELEYSLGDGLKRVEENENQTVILQRRAIRLSRNLPADQPIRFEDLEVLRPCPMGALTPRFMDEVVGRSLRQPMSKGEHIEWINLK